MRVTNIRVEMMHILIKRCLSASLFLLKYSWHYRIFKTNNNFCSWLSYVVPFVCVLCLNVCVCCVVSYSPDHLADHDQSWHDNNPLAKDGANHFSRLRSYYVYMLSYSQHHWTDHDLTWYADGLRPRRLYLARP